MTKMEKRPIITSKYGILNKLDVKLSANMSSWDKENGSTSKSKSKEIQEPQVLKGKLTPSKFQVTAQATQPLNTDTPYDIMPERNYTTSKVMDHMEDIDATLQDLEPSEPALSVRQGIALITRSNKSNQNRRSIANRQSTRRLKSFRADKSEVPDCEELRAQKANDTELQARLLLSPSQPLTLDETNRPASPLKNRLLSSAGSIKNGLTVQTTTRIAEN